MVMALRAIQTPAEKNTHLLGAHLGSGGNDSIGQVMPGRAMVTLGSYALARDLVVWFVRRNAVPQPLRIHLAPLHTPAVSRNGNTEQIGETKGPVIHELRRGH